MASVEIKSVEKFFGAHPVLRNVSIDIADGEFTVLVGPSGCGKSTLLRMIAGLEEISGGSIAIGSKIVNNVEPKDRDIAMVFQNYALYPHMTVAENMGFALRLKGLPKDERRRRIEQAAGVLSIQDLLERYPRQLSGGQRQRVAMGRAIVRDPAVFLFDEPLSNLDAKLRVQVRAEIKELHQRLKTTTIYVTHDQVEAMTMADRIVVLKDGLVMQIGTPLEIYDRPDNMFVAGFIGSPGMNFVEGVVSNEADNSFLAVDGVSLPLSQVPDGSSGKRLAYGIRPENIHVDPTQGIPATVIIVEPTGSETNIVAMIGKNSVVCTFRKRINCRPGDTIPLYPDVHSVHIFDIESEKRISSEPDSKVFY
jgi:multiple sugar transport system ATP-binding protein